jgi:hypothetical protein
MRFEQPFAGTIEIIAINYGLAPNPGREAKLHF